MIWKSTHLEQDEDEEEFVHDWHTKPEPPVSCKAEQV